MEVRADRRIPTELRVILDRLAQHESNAAISVNMVPSENAMSPLAKLPLTLDVYHRYFFNDLLRPDEWNFRGAQEVGSIESEIAVPLLRELASADFVNLRPLSGLSGMMLVLSALGGPPGSTIMTVSPEQGGHYATASIAARLGLEVCMLSGPDAHTIDFDHAAKVIRDKQPTLVYVDQSNCLFPLDVANLVEVVRASASGALVHVDASHWMGLIFGAQLPNPLEAGADSFGGSTHKSFPGPHKAVFATNRSDLAQRVRDTQFFLISSHHFASVLALTLAMLEFKECDGNGYARRIISNTQRFGAELERNGLVLDAADRGFSAGHQLWVRTEPGGVNAFEASEQLYAAGIRVNVFPELPGIPEAVLRIGLNEATYHGLDEADMATLAEVFAQAVSKRSETTVLRERVAELRGKYWLPYSFTSRYPDAVESALELIGHAMRGTTSSPRLNSGEREAPVAATAERV
jgi:glycine hydroxymethyltransferase